MKAVVISLMVVQVILFTYGVKCFADGNIGFGLFHTILNGVCFFINLNTLNNLSD